MKPARVVLSDVLPTEVISDVAGELCWSAGLPFDAGRDAGAPTMRDDTKNF